MRFSYPKCSDTLCGGHDLLKFPEIIIDMYIAMYQKWIAPSHIDDVSAIKMAVKCPMISPSKYCKILAEMKYRFVISSREIGSKVRLTSKVN